jgi:transposase
MLEQELAVANGIARPMPEMIPDTLPASSTAGEKRVFAMLARLPDESCATRRATMPFWLARFLKARGIECLVVDSGSIQVNRRSRRAKTDRIDLAKLLRALIAWCWG